MAYNCFSYIFCINHILNQKLSLLNYLYYILLKYYAYASYAILCLLLQWHKVSHTKGLVFRYDTVWLKFSLPWPQQQPLIIHGMSHVDPANWAELALEEKFYCCPKTLWFSLIFFEDTSTFHSFFQQTGPQYPLWARYCDSLWDTKKNKRDPQVAQHFVEETDKYKNH